MPQLIPQSLIKWATQGNPYAEVVLTTDGYKMRINMDIAGCKGTLYFLLDTWTEVMRVLEELEELGY